MQSKQAPRTLLITKDVNSPPYLLNKKACNIRGNEKKRLPSYADFVDIRGN